MTNNKDVGTATPAKAMKTLWRKDGKGFSLKAFARTLLKAGEQVAKDWFAVKKGKLNTKRSDANQKRVELERTATKAAKKSKGKK